MKGYEKFSLIKTDVEIQDHMMRVVETVTIRLNDKDTNLYVTPHKMGKSVSIHNILDWGTLVVDVEQAKVLVAGLKNAIHFLTGEDTEKEEEPVGGIWGF